MTLYLLRHGETEENVQHILQGHMPGTLTETGKAQARALAEEVRSHSQSRNPHAARSHHDQAAEGARLGLSHRNDCRRKDTNRNTKRRGEREADESQGTGFHRLREIHIPGNVGARHHTRTFLPRHTVCALRGGDKRHHPHEKR